MVVQQTRSPGSGRQGLGGRRRKGADRSLTERSDRWLLAGIILCGTFVLGPIGTACLVYAFVLLNRAQKQGIAIRPWPVTIMGAFCLLDAGLNFVGMAMVVFPAHDTTVASTFLSGFGKLFDGGYYIDWNSLAIGGSAAPGEMSWIGASVLVVFPLRVAACWAFIKMKRWGLQYMVISTWMYMVVWVGYAWNLTQYFPQRLGSGLFGVLGYWAFNIPFFGPFILLPYLHTVNRELFTD